MPQAAYDRILLKLSGEALMGSRSSGIDPATIDYIVGEIRPVVELGVKAAVVVGGGNFVRGARMSQTGIDRVAADHMGMLATVINAIALQEAMTRAGIAVRVQSAIAMNELVEPFIRGRAIRHLEKGRVVVFASGTGNPYFSTDTAAALRAAEVGAQVILKATKVDGVYSQDPVQNPGAERFQAITYRRFLESGLKVMDATAVSLSMEVGIPVIVFSLTEPGNVLRAVCGEPVGTRISAEPLSGRS